MYTYFDKNIILAWGWINMNKFGREDIAQISHDEPLDRVHSININMIRGSGGISVSLGQLRYSFFPISHRFSCLVRRIRKHCRSASEHEASVVPVHSQSPDHAPSYG